MIMATNLLPSVHAVAEIPAGSINLAPFPGLTYAPHQHGEGIRFAHNGHLIDPLVAHKDTGLLAALDAHATQVGVSLVDYLDGLRFLRAHGLI